MCISKNLKNDSTIPKKLCNLGVCISLSQGRRFVHCLPEIKLEKIIKEAEENQKKKEKI